VIRVDPGIAFEGQRATTLAFVESHHGCSAEGSHRLPRKTFQGLPPGVCPSVPGGNRLARSDGTGPPRMAVRLTPSTGRMASFGIET
jgi:hypothetical protein